MSARSTKSTSCCQDRCAHQLQRGILSCTLQWCSSEHWPLLAAHDKLTRCAGNLRRSELHEEDVLRLETLGAQKAEALQRRKAGKRRNMPRHVGHGNVVRFLRGTDTDANAAQVEHKSSRQVHADNR